MSGESNRTPAARKKRVQTLKKLIILIWILSIAIPSVCCVLLFIKVRSLDNVLQKAMAQLEDLSQVETEKDSVQHKMREEALGGEETVPEEEDSEIQGTEDDGIRKVYLTFDDGPSIYTDEILDILDRYEVKATFFVVGKEDDASKEALQEIVKRGHSLGMHSFSHKYSEVYASTDSFMDDLKKLQDYLYDITGVKSNLYRFPGGSSNTVSRIDMREFAACLADEDIIYFDWNISSGDGGKILLSIEDLVTNCTENLTQRDNAIILLHDSADKKTSVEALPEIIENILALEDTVILPITEDTEPVQHIHITKTESEE